MNKVVLLINSLSVILNLIGCSVKEEHLRLSAEIQPQCQNLVEQYNTPTETAATQNTGLSSTEKAIYVSHLNDLSQETGTLPLVSGSVSSSKFTAIQQSALNIFEKDFKISQIKTTSRMKKSIQNALTLMCITQYQNEEDHIKMNWYDLLQTRMKSIVVHADDDESCLKGVLAFVEYSQDTVKSQVIHLCPKFQESSNILDMAVTLLHESRHSDNHGWYENDYRQISMSNFFQEFGETYRDYFQNYGKIDTNERFTNNQKMPGYPHAPCDDNFNEEKMFEGSPACDPVFIPFQNLQTQRISQLGGGAYSYDIYFYSRIADSAQNIALSASNWSCEEGFMLLNTRFSRYEDEAGNSSAKPSSEILLKNFKPCLML